MSSFRIIHVDATEIYWHRQISKIIEKGSAQLNDDCPREYNIFSVFVEFVVGFDVWYELMKQFRSNLLFP